MPASTVCISCCCAASNRPIESSRLVNDVDRRRSLQSVPIKHVRGCHRLQRPVDCAVSFPGVRLCNLKLFKSDSFRFQDSTFYARQMLKKIELKTCFVWLGGGQIRFRPPGVPNTSDPIGYHKFIIFSSTENKPTLDGFKLL